MAGLDPAIHVFVTATMWRRGCPAQGRAWRVRTNTLIPSASF